MICLLWGDKIKGRRLRLKREEYKRNFEGKQNLIWLNQCLRSSHSVQGSLYLLSAMCL